MRYEETKKMVIKPSEIYVGLDKERVHYVLRNYKVIDFRPPLAGCDLPKPWGVHPHTGHYGHQ